MSNPAVIVLDNASSIKKFKRFVIEDNIGESIHIHIDNIRIDFTIEEFLNFAVTIRKSVEEMDLLKGHSISNFDESFLKNCSPLIPNLLKINKEKIKLKDLTCIKHSTFYGEIYDSKSKLNETKAYEFLNNNNADFLEYPQFNYFGIDNKLRLNNLLDSVKKNGYPHNDNFIILFNGQNIIRDGQHRAIILAHLFGLNHEVEVLRFYFKGSNHLIKFYKTNFIKFFMYCLSKIFNLTKKIIKKIIKK